MGNSATAAIDTHAYIKKLIKVGFTEEQAEAQTDMINTALKEFQDKQREDLATKADIAGVKVEIGEVKVEIGNVKAELKVMKWIGSFILGLVAAIFIMLLKSNLNF